MGLLLPPTGEETSSWKDNSTCLMSIMVVLKPFVDVSGFTVILWLWFFSFCISLWSYFSTLYVIVFIFLANVSWICDIFLTYAHLVALWLFSIVVVTVFILLLGVLCNFVIEHALCVFVCFFHSFFQHCIQKRGNISSEFINWSFRSTP